MMTWNDYEPGDWVLYYENNGFCWGQVLEPDDPEYRAASGHVCNTNTFLPLKKVKGEPIGEVDGYPYNRELFGLWNFGKNWTRINGFDGNAYVPSKAPDGRAICKT